MADETLKVARTGNYVTLTLNRPEKRNALNQPLISALDQALASIEKDVEIRAVLLCGEGRHFCAGVDLQELSRSEGPHNPVSLEGMFHRLEQLPMPTIPSSLTTSTSVLYWTFGSVPPGQP